MSSGRKASEVIRVTPYVRAILEVHMSQQKVKRGIVQYSINDALQDIFEDAIPEVIEEVHRLRPDLVPESSGNGHEA